MKTYLTNHEALKAMLEQAKSGKDINKIIQDELQDAKYLIDYKDPEPANIKDLLNTFILDYELNKKNENDNLEIIVNEYVNKLVYKTK